MTVRELIAHGGPQPLPTRAAPSLVKALRDARGSPPWTPWTILCRLDRHHPSYATCIRVDGANRCDPHADPIGRVRGVITITGIGDHLRPEWPITITGIRTLTFLRLEIIGLALTIFVYPRSHRIRRIS